MSSPHDGSGGSSTTHLASCFGGSGSSGSPPTAGHRPPSIVEPGTIFGEMVIVGQQMHDSFAETLDDVVV